MEELGEGLRNLKRAEAPRENQQGQVTWTFGGYQETESPKSEHGLDLGPLHVCSR